MANNYKMSIDQVWTHYKNSPTSDLRNRLVEEYLPIVRSRAARLKRGRNFPAGVELEDLASYGIFGLIDAINHFDLSKGVNFETYCVSRINGAMLDGLRQLDPVSRNERSKGNLLNDVREGLAKHEIIDPDYEQLTFALGERLYKKYSVSKNLEYRKRLESARQECGSSATDEQIAMALGKKYIDSYLASETIPTTGSLQKKLPCSTHSHSAHSPDTLEDTIDDRNPYSNPEARLTREDTLRNVTKTLNRNERLVVILYYYEELTMKEIGATLGLSESRVSQMHSSIVQRLQNSVSVQDHFGIKKAA